MNPKSLHQNLQTFMKQCVHVLVLWRAKNVKCMHCDSGRYKVIGNPSEVKLQHNNTHSLQVYCKMFCPMSTATSSIKWLNVKNPTRSFYAMHVIQSHDRSLCQVCNCGIYICSRYFRWIRIYFGVIFYDKQEKCTFILILKDMQRTWLFALISSEELHVFPSRENLANAGYDIQFSEIFCSFNNHVRYTVWIDLATLVYKIFVLWRIKTILIFCSQEHLSIPSRSRDGSLRKINTYITTFKYCINVHKDIQVGG